jgi:hypothetical protein
VQCKLAPDCITKPTAHALALHNSLRLELDRDKSAIRAGRDRVYDVVAARPLKRHSAPINKIRRSKKKQSTHEPHRCWNNLILSMEAIPKTESDSGKFEF